MAAGKRAWANNLLRSTPVRQALVIVAVVAAVNLLSLGGAYLKLRADLGETIRSELHQEIAGFDVAATPGALAALVAAKARAADPETTVFVFLRADGRQIGNAEAVVEGGEVRLTSRNAERPLGQSGYVHEVRRHAGGVLIVAESLAPIADLADTFLSLLVFSLVPTVLISLAVGALVARRSARRVERVEGTLESLAAGDLSARYDASDHLGDDLSRIGAGVNRMAMKQEAATEALRQVSADIAHDLRTPLQRISVLLHELKSTLPDSSEATVFADQAADEAARAVSVFQSLLQIAQIDSGSPASRFADVDLASVTRQIADLYEPTAEDAADTLTVDLPDAPVIVHGDQDLIGQAAANLIENALRHTPRDSRIELSVRNDPDGPTLTVADNGPGIPPEERQNVLRRLYRLERSRTTPGHGLGLALVSSIATLHSAGVTLADNDPGLKISLLFPPGKKAA